MCGRFVSSSPPDQIAAYFDVDAVSEQVLDRGPNFNTAPTTGVFVVFEDGTTRHLDSFRWGLVPFWAKDLSVGNRMINARAETVAEKSAFKRSLARRRCIVPADGFYEWTEVAATKAASTKAASTKAASTKGRATKTKQPYFIHRPDDEPFAFAGLWEEWKGPKDTDTDAEIEPVRSCTIITTEANDKMSELHDRMPVILPRSAWDQWLSTDRHDVELLGKLLVPAPSELIAFHPVSTEVNNARNSGEHLIEPVDY